MRTETERFRLLPSVVEGRHGKLLPSRLLSDGGEDDDDDGDEEELTEEEHTFEPDDEFDEEDFDDDFDEDFEEDLDEHELPDDDVRPVTEQGIDDEDDLADEEEDI
jgi:hypothetical protein